MQTDQHQQNKPSLVQRLQLREVAPDWSISTGLIFAGAYVVLVIAGQVIAATISGSTYTAPSPGAIAIGTLLGSIVTIIGVVQWVRRRQGDTWTESIRLRPPLKPSLTLIALIALGAAWATDLVGLALRLRTDQTVPLVIARLNGPVNLTWIATAVLAIVVQPIVEGLVFAGVLYPALARDTKNNLYAAALCGVVYVIASVIVLAAGSGVWYSLIQPFIMALVMVLVRAYTQSTQSAIVARAMFGLFFVISVILYLR
jgi:membrane protease YdiL (CAAX protease family)